MQSNDSISAHTQFLIKVSLKDIIEAYLCCPTISLWKGLSGQLLMFKGCSSFGRLSSEQKTKHESWHSRLSITQPQSSLLWSSILCYQNIYKFMSTYFLSTHIFHLVMKMLLNLSPTFPAGPSLTEPACLWLLSNCTYYHVHNGNNWHATMECPGTFIVPPFSASSETMKFEGKHYIIYIPFNTEYI